MAYSRQSNGNDDDLEELLRKADQVLDDVPPEAPEEDSTPAPWEDLRFYANYSNHYGRDVRNYQNNYGRPQSPFPKSREPVRESAIPAYNVDFQEQGRARTSRSAGTQTPRRSAWEEDRLDGYAPSRPAPAGKAPKKKRRKKHRVLKFFLVLLLVLLIAAAGVYLWLSSIIRMPQTDAPHWSTKARRGHRSAVRHRRGGNQNRHHDAAIPERPGKGRQPGQPARDTLTHTTAGSNAKLNSAYGRNNGGEEGMEALLDYVSDIIGYRPDGYMLVSLDAFVDIVDLMGGIEFDVPMDMFYEDPSQDLYIDLKAGLQKLDGYEAMGLVRFRKGYADQDLGRVDVQRQFISACMDQWLTISNIGKVPQVLSTMQASSTSDLTTGNLLWIALNAWRSGFGNMQTATLPGYADMIDGASYYVLDPEGVADVINSSCNPYRQDVDADDLNIVY